MFSICITGHRPNKLFWYDIHIKAYDGIRSEIQRCIRKLVDESGETELVAYSGMALGIDQIFVEELVKWNEVNETKFRIVAAVPCKGQEGIWPQESQKYYRYLLKNCCDKVVYVCPPGYEGWKMNVRNKYMVDNVDHVLAVWDGSAGGTGNCVSYTKQKKKDLVIIHPRTLQCVRVVYHKPVTE